jgi:ribulose-5-phosphate 4-epimerase/fuculose-1-phosphate aldolase
MSVYDEFKQQVLTYSRELAQQGFFVGTGGNLSVRIEGEDGLAITPSGHDYGTLSQDDICVYDFDKQPLETGLSPSVEMPMHIAVYRQRPDVNAVIHTHQPFASTFALINQPIPPLFDEQVLNLGPQVEIVPYGLSGSPDLLENIAAHLDNQCNAYILQNHGALCLGLTVEQAVVNMKLLEKCARVYYYALTTGQQITGLDPKSEEILFSMLKSEQRKEVRRKRRAARSKR